MEIKRKGNQWGKGRYVGYQQGKQEAKKETILYSLGSLVVGTLIGIFFGRKG